MKKHSLRPLPKLKKEAEKWVHWYVRLRDCLKTTGTLSHGKCFTCESDCEIRYFQAGHFRHNKLDYDEDNLRGQCIRCNCYLSGNLGIYAINLIKELGQKKVDELVERSNQSLSNKYSRSELEEIIAKYKQKVADLSKKKML